MLINWLSTVCAYWMLFLFAYGEAKLNPFIPKEGEIYLYFGGQYISVFYMYNTMKCIIILQNDYEVLLND